MTGDSYIIRGGLPGRERLKLLARVMRPATLALLQRAGVAPGMACLDLGCGPGDVACELGRLVGPKGSVIGLDIDRIKLKTAQVDARDAGLRHVEFRAGDVGDPELVLPPADVGYARFLLTHLPDPLAMLRHLVARIRPGGLLILEDIEISSQVAWPPSPALAAYIDIYRRTALARGVDPDIGPRLPSLLREAGVPPAEVQFAQPAGLTGEVKRVSALTMEGIADAAIAAGIADAPTIAAIAAELHRLADDDTTLLSIVRVTQTWGRKAA